jgi:hypothetical protein
MLPQKNKKSKKGTTNTHTSKTKPEPTLVCFKCQTEFTKTTALQIHQIYLDTNHFPHGLGTHINICCPKCKETNYHPKNLKVLCYRCDKCTSEFSVHKLWWRNISLVDDQGKEIELEQHGLCPNCQHTGLHPITTP